MKYQVYCEATEISVENFDDEAEAKSKALQMTDWHGHQYGVRKVENLTKK